jgi:LIVCS family branched-chain amino acid:cation transporter
MNTEFSTFLLGLQEGYSTMDLPGALFFSSVVLNCLESDVTKRTDKHNYKNLVFMTLKASVIGATLLSLVYIGFSYIAAFNSDILKDTPTDQLLGAVALHIMGPYAGIVAIVAVALACLTTAIALCAVFAEFLADSIPKLTYRPSLIITLVLTFLVSTLSFQGIAAFLTPILIVVYPALIVLAGANLLFKLHHFKPVVIPFTVTLVISLVAYLVPDFLTFK